MEHPHIDRAIDYIEFTVPDLTAVKKFYSEIFDWKFQDWGDEYASFSDGRVDGGFARGDAKPGRGILVILYSTNLEEIQQKVRAAGGAIVKDIFSFPGGRRFHFADPAGNELAIWSDK
ncbi:VOC family protein [Alloacidobacterium sp.]|uniref:VOC family protein n=1 Tax=Alloacidobacterium sp. TaxID=2951999 RepID=UPI002D591048|nr:VOC family protein [Alloacidobacterium sp.]HYK35928.1 VOC family protein [Alloacidobacterium sp.]